MFSPQCISDTSPIAAVPIIKKTTCLKDSLQEKVEQNEYM